MQQENPAESNLFDPSETGASEEEKKEERKRQFLNIISEDDIKRRHYETHDELRKEKREKRFEKRRGLDEVEAELNANVETLISPDKIAAMKFTIQDLPQFVGLINSTDLTQIYLGVIGVRKLLAKKEESPIQEIIDANVVPRLIQLLDLTTMPNIQYEAAWCLTNIATGTREQVQCLTEKGAVPRLILLMNSEQDNLKEQAIWALGNIAGENIEYRDMVLSCGMLPVLVNLLATTKKLTILKNGCWVLSNLIRGKPQPDFSKLKDAIPVLCKIIKEYDDKELLSDCCWALSNLGEGGGAKILYLVEQDVLPRLVQLLGSPHTGIMLPALRCLGNVITGNDKETQLAIDAGIVPELGKLLMSPKSSVRKEAAWALSNITAGTAAQIQTVFNEGSMAKIISLASQDTFDVRRECIWAISNGTSGANLEQLRYLVELGAAEALCSILVTNDARTLAIALEGIENLLRKSKNYLGDSQAEAVALRIDQCGGLTSIGNLQIHSNTHIYKKAIGIIEEFFGAEEEAGEPEPIESISIFNF